MVSVQAMQDKLVPISFPFPLRDSPDPLDLVSQAKTVSHGMMWLLMLTQPGQTNRSLAPSVSIHIFFCLDRSLRAKTNIASFLDALASLDFTLVSQSVSQS